MMQSLKYIQTKTIQVIKQKQNYSGYLQTDYLRSKIGISAPLILIRYLESTTEMNKILMEWLKVPSDSICYIKLYIYGS